MLRQLAVAFALTVTSVACASPAFAAVSIGPEGSGSDIELKSGVVIDKLHADLLSALPILPVVWTICEAGQLVITSGNDSTAEHRDGSFHGRNRALDLRGKFMTPMQRECVSKTLPGLLSKPLAGRWVLLWEDFGPGAARNHFHLHLSDEA